MSLEKRPKAIRNPFPMIPDCVPCEHIKTAVCVRIRPVVNMHERVILRLTEFEQYVDSGTDTVVYGFNNLVKLLLDCNPNNCEILGLPRDKYMIISPLAEELLENPDRAGRLAQPG